jgi:hypothetical protein
MYARLGFGLYLTELKESGVPLGICGLIKRDGLEDVDIGICLSSEVLGERLCLRVGCCCGWRTGEMF